MLNEIYVNFSICSFLDHLAKWSHPSTTASIVFHFHIHVLQRDTMFFVCCDRNNNLFSHWDFKQLRKINTNLKHSFKNTRFNLIEQYWQIMIASLVQMMCLIDLRFNSSANYLAIEFVLHAHYAYNEKKIICAPLSQFAMFTFPDINQLIWKNINHLIWKFKSTKKTNTYKNSIQMFGS